MQKVLRSQNADGDAAWPPSTKRITVPRRCPRYTDVRSPSLSLSRTLSIPVFLSRTFARLRVSFALTLLADSQSLSLPSPSPSFFVIFLSYSRIVGPPLHHCAAFALALPPRASDSLVFALCLCFAYVLFLSLPLSTLYLYLFSFFLTWLPSLLVSISPPFLSILHLLSLSLPPRLPLTLSLSLLPRIVRQSTNKVSLSLLVPRGGLSRRLPPSGFFFPSRGFYISLSFVSPDRVFHSKIERQRACHARIFAAKTANSRLHARTRSIVASTATCGSCSIFTSHFARVMRPPRSGVARLHSRAGCARLSLFLS